MYKIAVIFLAACLFCSGTCYAGVKLYQQRLQKMSKSERENLNNKTQKSDADADADAYSRDLSETERRLFERLWVDYENGKFPEGQLLTVEKAIEVPKETLAYCYENATFYLPEKELSEQQMLEIVDFDHKRDYAVVQENQQKQTVKHTLAPAAEQQKVWESQAKDFMESLLGLSVQNIQYSEPEAADGNEESIEMTCSSKDWEYSYSIRMDAQSGEISAMGFDGFGEDKPFLNSEISINEALYKSRREELIKNVEAFYHKKVTKLTLYYNHVKGKLSRGNTKYAVCLDDDTMVVLMYSEALNRIYSFYVTDYDYFQNIQKDSRRVAKMRGHKDKKVELF